MKGRGSIFTSSFSLNLLMYLKLKKKEGKNNNQKVGAKVYF